MPQGDVFFPPVDLSGWQVVEEERCEADERHSSAYTFQTSQANPCPGPPTHALARCRLRVGSGLPRQPPRRRREDNRHGIPQQRDHDERPGQADGAGLAQPRDSPVAAAVLQGQARLRVQLNHPDEQVACARIVTIRHEP